MATSSDGLEKAKTEAMKSVSSALQLEENGRWQDSYNQYVQCCLKISNALMHDAFRGSSSPGSASPAFGAATAAPSAGIEDANRLRLRLSQLGQQCFERLSSLCQSFEEVSTAGGHRRSSSLLSLASPTSPSTTLARPARPPRPSGASGSTTPVSSAPAPAERRSLLEKRESNPLKSPTGAAPRVMTSRPQKEVERDPVAQARIENSRIKALYEQRMEQIRRRGGNPTNVQLEMCRKMAENLDIAKSKKVAVSFEKPFDERSLT